MNQPEDYVFRRVRKIAESDYLLCHICPFIRPSVRPHGATRLSLDGFSYSLIFECFRKSVEKIQVLLKSDKNKGHFT